MPALLDIALSPNPPATIGLPMAEIVRRAAVVSADSQFAARVGQAMEERYPPFVPAQIVEQRMKEGFPSRADENQMQAFNKADWRERAEIAESFEADIYRELARRLVFANAPGGLPDPRRTQLQAWFRNQRHGRDGFEVGKTISGALAELDNDSSADPPPEAEAIRSWLSNLD